MFKDESRRKEQDSKLNWAACEVISFTAARSFPALGVIALGEFTSAGLLEPTVPARAGRVLSQAGYSSLGPRTSLGTGHIVDASNVFPAGFWLQVGCASCLAPFAPLEQEEASEDGRGLLPLLLVELAPASLACGVGWGNRG